MTGLLIKFGLVAVLIGSLFFYGRHVGWQERDLMAAKDSVAASEEARGIEAKYFKLAMDSVQVNDARQAEIQWRTKVLIQRVPKYVTPIADSRCVVPTGFVQLYDAAVAGSDLAPAAAGQSFDNDSGIALSRVAETDQYNLGVAKSALTEVQSWRKWYAALAALPRP